jgi:plasmid stability protein
VVRLGASLFPDNLGLAVVINAPTIFHFAWQILKRVLPDDTIARVQIRADDGRSVLEEILGGAAALDALLASRDEERSAAQAGLFVLGVDLDHLVAEQGQHENPQEPKTAHSEQQQLVGLSLLTA